MQLIEDQTTLKVVNIKPFKNLLPKNHNIDRDTLFFLLAENTLKGENTDSAPFYVGLSHKYTISVNVPQCKELP